MPLCPPDPLVRLQPDPLERLGRRQGDAAMLADPGEGLLDPAHQRRERQRRIGIVYLAERDHL